MKTVSFQGAQISPKQRQALEQQRRVKQLMNPVLSEQVAQTLAVIEVRKEQGAKPEKQYFLVSETHGTPSFAEWMGY